MNRFFVAASAAISGLRPPARFADFQFGAEELEDTVAAIIASAEFDLPGVGAASTAMRGAQA
jgi:hypothetical protein